MKPPSATAGEPVRLTVVVSIVSVIVVTAGAALTTSDSKSPPAALLMRALTLLLLNFLSDLPALLVTYDLYDGAEAAAVKALMGETAISGRLPISMPGVFELGAGLQRSRLSTGQLGSSATGQLGSQR